jgi:plastocyanin
MNVSRLVCASALLAVACGGGGYSGGSPTAPSTPTGGGGGQATTIAVGSAGVNPNQIRIEIGQSVTFQNNSSRTVTINSDPHPTHELCPPLEAIGVLAPGQSHTATFTVRGTCTYHEHTFPDDSRFRGTILVGVQEPGPAPDYRTAQ